MIIDETLTSLEISKKLKYLGLNQKSYFSWYAFENPINNIFKESDLDEDKWRIGISRDCSKGGADWVYSAFTTGELFEMLPAYIQTKINEPFDNFWLSLNKREAKNIQYIGNYHCDTTYGFERPIYLFKHNIYDESISECLAKILIYLLENNLLNEKWRKQWLN